MHLNREEEDDSNKKQQKKCNYYGPSKKKSFEKGNMQWNTRIINVHEQSLATIPISNIKEDWKKSKIKEALNINAMDSNFFF